MHLLDAWVAVAPADLVRLLGIPAALLVATLLPGRGIARIAAVLVAVAVALLAELALPWPARALWALLWLVVASQAGSQGPDRSRARASRRGALEAGAVALPLGGALILLLLAAVSREPLAPLDGRRASLGVLVLGAGLLHLMMRRHVRRTGLAFAALGLGLELLAAAARAVDVTHAGPAPGAALAATAVAVAVAWRIAETRERTAGSSLVSDAHELQD